MGSNAPLQSSSRPAVHRSIRMKTLEILQFMTGAQLSKEAAVGAEVALSGLRK